MLDESKNINMESKCKELKPYKAEKKCKEDNSMLINEVLITSKNKKIIYPRLLDKKEYHYYYTDKDNINGMKNNYYFKCSSVNSGIMNYYIQRKKIKFIFYQIYNKKIKMNSRNNCSY